jgi:hypothetical protein
MAMACMGAYVAIIKDTPDPQRVVAETAWRKH